jgi:acetolactate synthase I/II/III large subunit
MSDFSGPDAVAAIRRAFGRCGVQWAFGLPGGPNRALFQQLRGNPTRLLVPTHELAAAFMAGAYGRVSGRPGVLLTIPGPGFAYALAGIAEAWLDSAPLLHIVNAPASGPHQALRHQALDQRRIAAPLVKAVIEVGRVADLEEALGEAYRATTAGEPGPVLVQLGASGAAASAPPTTTPHDARDGTADARAIWQRIHRARKPVLFLGQGCAGAADAIGRYIARTGTPVFTTASGRGIVPEQSPWCLGFDSLRQPVATLNAFLAEADLVIAVGARLAHNGTAGFRVALSAERLVHVDASSSNLNALYPASAVAALSADAFFGLPECTRATASDWSPAAVAEWRARIRTPRPDAPEPRIAGQPAADFFAQLRAQLPDEALVVTDSGLHQVMARRYFEVRAAHGLLMPTDLQSMGFGLPAAIAAKLAAPARPVVALIGDGGALMSGLELAIAVRERIALTVLVFNDGYLNQIRLQQLRDRGTSHGIELPQLDFSALARAVGARYLEGTAATLSRLREIAGGAEVTLIEVPVTDSAAIVANAAEHRAKAAVGDAIGPSLRGRLKRWLRR